jgi:hypothetical protein
MNRSTLSSLVSVGCIRLAFFLCVVSFPVGAQTGLPEQVDRDSAKLHVARNGSEVLISWEVPAEQVRVVEVYRNTTMDVKGRGRRGSLRPLPASMVDTVPDGNPYWYWLKVIFKDGQTMNVGPAVTPPADVWTP